MEQLGFVTKMVASGYDIGLSKQISPTFEIIRAYDVNIHYIISKKYHYENNESLKFLDYFGDHAGNITIL